MHYPKSSKNLVGFLHMGKLCVQIFFQKGLVWPSTEEQLESWLVKSQIMLSLWPHEDGPRDKKPTELYTDAGLISQVGDALLCFACHACPMSHSI